MVVPKKLVIGKELEDGLIDMIKERFPTLMITVCSDESDLNEFIHDADILLTRIIPEDPSMAPRLKWVHFLWEGVDSMSEDFAKTGIILTNSSGAHSVHISEHVLMYLINLSRKAFMYKSYQDRSEWLGWLDQPGLLKLSGTTIGILGYGRIGRAVAKIAEGFGMHVLALKRDPCIKKQDQYHAEGCCDMEGSIPSRFYGPDELMDMLPMCDHVVLSLPLTAQTEDLFGEDQFRAMKDTAFFVNIGRGALVVEDALVSALRDGWIAGAGLDVFRKEPLPATSPLWDLENLIITPHASVGGDPAEEEVIDLFLENMERFIDGRKMLNVIDKGKGY